jgi:hypothetical protein
VSPIAPATAIAASSQHGRPQRTTAASVRPARAAVTVARAVSPQSPTAIARAASGPVTDAGASTTRAHQSAAAARKPSPTSRVPTPEPARRVRPAAAPPSACIAIQPSSMVPAGTGHGSRPRKPAAATATLSGPR